MTLQIPTVSDPEVQRALDVIAMAFPVGWANLPVRLSFGAVGATGGVLSGGSGDWSVAHTGTGSYTVTFAPVFSVVPVVVASSSQSPAGGAYDVETSVSSGSSFGVLVRQPGVAFIDCAFSFVAIGARR